MHCGGSWEGGPPEGAAGSTVIAGIGVVMDFRSCLYKVFAVFVVSISFSTTACERVWPRLDEVRIACGFSARERQDSPIVLFTDAEGRVLTRSELKVAPRSGGGRSVTLSEEGCLLLHGGTGTWISVRDGRPGRNAGVVLGPGAVAAGRVTKVTLQPIASMEAFETCGHLGPFQRGWIRLQRAGGGAIMKDELRVDEMDPDRPRLKRALEVSPFGCVYLEERQEALAIALDGKGAAHLGGAEREQGRAELDDRITKELLLECRANPQEPLRSSILSRRVTVFSPSASSTHGAAGSRADTRWSLCAQPSGCAPSRWIDLDKTPKEAGQELGRCVAVAAAPAMTGGARLLRRDTGSDGNFSLSEIADLTAPQARPGDSQVVTLAFTSFVSAGSAARLMTIRFPQCTSGTIPLTRESRLLVQVASGPNERGIPVGLSVVLDVGTKEGNILIEGSQALTPNATGPLGGNVSTLAFPVGTTLPQGTWGVSLESRSTFAFTAHLRDAFGRIATLASGEACALQPTKALSEAGGITLRRSAATFDKGDRFPIIPVQSQALLDGVQFAYALLPLSSARTPTNARASFDTQEECLGSDLFQHARGESVPLAQSGRFEILIRACARNGTYIDLAPRTLHVNGSNPDIHVRPNPTMRFSGTLTSLGEPAYLRVEGLVDDVLGADELLAGVNCEADVALSGRREKVPAKCRLHQRVAGEDSAILRLEWDWRFILASNEVPTGLRVIVSVPTGDERKPHVSSFYDLPLFGSSLGTATYVGAFLTDEFAADEGGEDRRGTLAIGNDRAGNVLVLTSDFRLFRVRSSDSVWEFVLNAPEAYPGRVSKTASGRTSSERGRVDLDSSAPFMAPQPRPGLVFEMSDGEFGILARHSDDVIPYPDTIDDDAITISRSDTRELALLRVVCKIGAGCRTPSRVRNPAPGFDFGERDGRWYLIENGFIRTGSINAPSFRSYRIDPSHSKRLRRSSFRLDPWDRAWLEELDEVGRTTLSILDLERGTLVTAAEIYPQLSEFADEFDAETGEFVTHRPRLGSLVLPYDGIPTSRIAYLNSYEGCTLTIDAANCGRFIENGLFEEHRAFLSETRIVILTRDFFASGATTRTKAIVFDAKSFEPKASWLDGICPAEALWHVDPATPWRATIAHSPKGFAVRASALGCDTASDDPAASAQRWLEFDMSSGERTEFPVETEEPPPSERGSIRLAVAVPTRQSFNGKVLYHTPTQPPLAQLDAVKKHYSEGMNGDYLWPLLEYADRIGLADDPDPRTKAIARSCSNLAREDGAPLDECKEALKGNDDIDAFELESLGNNHDDRVTRLSGSGLVVVLSRDVSATEGYFVEEVETGTRHRIDADWATVFSGRIYGIRKDALGRGVQALRFELSNGTVEESRVDTYAAGQSPDCGGCEVTTIGIFAKGTIHFLHVGTPVAEASRMFRVYLDEATGDLHLRSQAADVRYELRGKLTRSEKGWTPRFTEEWRPWPCSIESDPLAQGLCRSDSTSDFSRWLVYGWRMVEREAWREFVAMPRGESQDWSELRSVCVSCL